MLGILLISHGKYAEAFKESLKMIVGQVNNVYSVGLEPTDGPQEFKEKLKNIEKSLISYDEVVIFSDLLGGSPSNTAFQYFLSDNKFKFITGMNFAMVLSTILSEDSTIENIIQNGKDAIVDLRDFANSISFSNDED